MFGLGMPEILMILAIALIVIGPKKLPDLAKTLGRAMGEFKRSAQDFKRSIDVETTVKDLKDIDVPKADLEGIIKDANFKDQSDSESAEEDTSESDDIDTHDLNKDQSDPNESDIGPPGSDESGKETPDKPADEIKADTEPVTEPGTADTENLKTDKAD